MKKYDVWSNITEKPCRDKLALTITIYIDFLRERKKNEHNEIAQYGYLIHLILQVLILGGAPLCTWKPN